MGLTEESKPNRFLKSRFLYAGFYCIGNQWYTIQLTAKLMALNDTRSMLSSMAHEIFAFLSN